MMLIVMGYLLALRSGSKVNSGKTNNFVKSELLKCDYAHRGLHNFSERIYENTMEAFALAVSNGYGIELDIQFTKDCKIVVFHDFDLKRMCGVDKRVNELNWDELSVLSIFMGPSRISLFEDVLLMVSGKVPLIIEIKSEVRESEICLKASQILDKYKGTYCVESFNPYVVYWFSHNRPDVFIGQLSMNFMKFHEEKNWVKRLLVTNLLLNFLQKPDFIAYNHTDSEKLSLHICKRFYKITCVGWTIKSQKEYDSAKQIFDIVIFEGFTPKHSGDGSSVFEISN